MKNNDNNFGFRDLPHNAEAERALIGSILYKNDYLDDVNGLINADHFAVSQNIDIWKNILALREFDQVINPITLLPRLDVELFPDGVQKYLIYLCDIVMASSSQSIEYAKIIVAMAARRQVILSAHEMISLASDLSGQNGNIKAMEIIEAAERDLAKIGDSMVHGNEPEPVSVAVLSALEDIEVAFKGESPPVLLTGLKSLDNILGGLQDGDLMILAGRPSMGKTSLAVNIAENVAKHGNPVMISSLEMKAKKLVARCIARETGISTQRQRSGDITEHDFQALSDAKVIISNLPLFIDDRPNLTVSNARSRLRRMIKKHGIKLWVIDYLQLMEAGDKYKGQRVNEVSEITRGLKLMAVELDIPIIVLSQLSRAVEQRDNKRPMLSDLRDSGSIEQDADIVAFCYREHYYLKNEKPVKSIKQTHLEYQEAHTSWQCRLDEIERDAEIIVSKQREGDTGTARMYFDGVRSLFSDKAYDSQEEMLY